MKEEREKNLIPTTGGFTYTFVKYLDNFVLNQKPNTIAEVKDSTEATQYLILSNGYIYQIHAYPIKSLAMELILKTLSFR